MLPRREARSVEREARLSRQRAINHSAARQHRRALRAEADRFSKFGEMLRAGHAPVEECLHVAGDQT